MNIRRKAVAIASSAALLASVFTVIAAPTALAAVSFGGVVAPAGGTSPTDLTATFTETAAACYAAGASPAALIVTIADSAGASTVHFTGTPTFTAPGSLGITGALQTLTATNDQLRINFAASDVANVEIFSVLGLKISADAGAASGAIIATLGGTQAGCILGPTGTATGTLSVTNLAAGGADPAVVLSGSCAFAVTTPVTFSPNSKVTFAGGDTGSITVAGPFTPVGVATLPPHPRSGDLQNIAIGPHTSNQGPGTVITQTVSIINCSNVIGSPGSVSNNVGQTSSVTEKGNNPTTVNPGEQNQPAGTITLTENAVGVIPVGTLTFTLSPAGVKFSAPPFVTARGTPIASPTGLIATANNGVVGGTCAAATFFYEITALTAFPGETTPTAPVSATTATAGSAVNLTWTAEPGATGYNVYGRPPLIAGVYGLIATLGPVTTFTDDCTVIPGVAPPVLNDAFIPPPAVPIVTPSVSGGLCPIGTQTYVVTAHTALGQTTASPSVTVSDVTTTSSNAISWTAVAGATGYSVYETTGAGRVVAANQPGTTVTDTCPVIFVVGLPPGANTAAIPAPSGLAATAASSPGTLVAGTYFYVVTALNAAGETLPSAPAGATITVANGSVTLTWTAVAGATGYRIYGRPSTSTGTFGLIGIVGAVTTFTDTGPATASGTVPLIAVATTSIPITLAGGSPNFLPTGGGSGSLLAGTSIFTPAGPRTITVAPAPVAGVQTVTVDTAITTTAGTVSQALGAPNFAIPPPLVDTSAGTTPAVLGSVCNLSFDRMSCTVAVTAVGTIRPTTIILSGPIVAGVPTGILLDVDATVLPGTAVDVTVTSSGALIVLVTSKTIAYVARVVVGIAAQPIIFINYNDQETGMITLAEQGAGFFTGGTGSNNVFGLCLTTGESFTRAPMAIVTIGDLKLNSAGLPVASLVGTLFADPGGRSCVRWTVYTASTVASTVEIRGTDAAGAILPSGPNNGPRLSVPGTSTPGTAQGMVLIGSLTNVNLGATAPCVSVPSPNPCAFSKLVSMATRAFKDSVVVAASSQPRIPAGATGALAGNVVITETLNGQFKPGQDICLQIQPRASNFAIQDTWFDSANQNTLPIVTTNAASGLLVSFVGIGGNSNCPSSPGGDNRGVAGFTVTQQSFGPTLGQITISNLRYITAADAPNGPVLLRVFVPPGNPGVQFSTYVSNAIIGPPIVLTRTGIIGAVAPGVSRSACNTDTATCEFKSRTPTVNSGAPGRHAYVTIRWRVSGLVSGKVQVYYQKKAIGVPFTQGWPGVFTKLTTVVVANGWAYYFADAKVLNANNPFHASFIGVVVETATTASSRSKAVQANWRP